MKIEVCCGSFTDVMAASDAGADRVELCSDLFFGGLTPSLGSFLLSKEYTDIEIAVMIRPREGGFHYSDDEFSVMLRDAELFVKNGASAIVFGALDREGGINEEQTDALCRLARGRCQAVFHRAFDICTTPLHEAIQTLKRLGVNRILTSGRCPTAVEGAANIKRMIDLAAGGIEILPAGLIRNTNVAQVSALTGCDQVHTSAFEMHTDGTAFHPSILLSGVVAPAQDEYRVANPTIIGNFVKAVREIC